MLSSQTLTERAGATVVLKAENLQRTGSFKLRGALAKIAALGDACARGVVSGKRRQPRPGRRLRGPGARRPLRGVHARGSLDRQGRGGRRARRDRPPGGDAVDESLGRRARARRDGGLAFVHPFDDPDVIAGQGGIGLELLAQVPDLARVIVPVGGGGLISGVAIALKSQRPRSR